MARYCEAGVAVTSDVVSAPDHLSAAVIGLPGAAEVPRRPLRRHRSHHELLTPISDPPPQRAERTMSITGTILTLLRITAVPPLPGTARKFVSTGRPVVDRPCSIRRPPIRHPHQGRTPKAKVSSTQSSTTTAVFEDQPTSPANGYETDDQIARSLSDLVDGRSEVSRRPSRWEQTRIAAILLPVSPPSVDAEQR